MILLLQQKNKLQPIIDELNIEIPEDPKEKINSPKVKHASWFRRRGFVA